MHSIRSDAKLTRGAAAAAGRVPIFEPLESRQLFAVTLPAFTETDLVSDGATPAQHTDPNLVNPWGVAVAKDGAIWVSDADTGVTTLYDQAGNPSPPVVTIPAGSAGGTAPTGSPTGAIFNTAGKAFDLPNTATPTKYVFVTEDGTVSVGSRRSATRPRSWRTTPPAARSTRAARSPARAARPGSTPPTSTPARSTSSTRPSSR